VKWKFWSNEKPERAEDPEGAQDAQAAQDAEATRRREVLPMVAERMRQFGHPDWTVQGDLVKGPGTVGIRLAESHSPSPTHLDLDFILNLDRPEETTIGDCVTGYGQTGQAGLRSAVETWATVTAATVLEMLTRNGTYAEHFHGNDPQGFPGWHSIHGPAIGFGHIDATPLQQWLVNTPILRLLAPSLAGELDRDRFHGVKLFFGGMAGMEVCEVRVNGRTSEAASDILFEQSWPRLEKMAFCRTFLLLVHPEDGS
jgi:Family of unknown function (DUF6348)